jgi:hypothetical protein
LQYWRRQLIAVLATSVAALATSIAALAKSIAALAKMQWNMNVMLSIARGRFRQVQHWQRPLRVFFFAKDINTERN